MSNYSCNFNLDDCIKKLDLEEGGLVQSFVTNEFKKNVQAYVPKDLAKKYENPGRLVDSCHIENGTDVVWNTPYARRLYYHPEYHFQTDENPFAGGAWLEPWLPGGLNQNFAQRAFRRFYKRASGV